MKCKLYCKVLAVGIIVLFLGVSVTSGFAVNTKTSAETVSIDSENENPVISSGEILENTNCFVMGYVTHSVSFLGLGILFQLNGDVSFGEWEEPILGTKASHSSGWIYTNGDSGKWRYDGDFRGNLETRTWHIGVTIYYSYIGIQGFRGIHTPQLFLLELFFWDVKGYMFLGFADKVGIKTLE